MKHISLTAMAGLLGLGYHLLTTRRFRALARGLREEEEALREQALHTARILGWLKEPEKHKAQLPAAVAQPVLPDLYVLTRRPAVPGPPYDYGNVTLKNGFPH